MSIDFTCLIVPSDAGKHARRFGAQYDQVTDVWFVIGEVPLELWNYLPKPEKRPFYEYSP